MTALETTAGTAIHLPDRARSLVSTLAGNRSDWGVRRRYISRPRPGTHWLGPLAVVGTTVAAWPAFTGAVGEDGGSVAFGLFIGAASIILMAWSFVLAVRVKAMERFFGGLDSMYRVHRWAGTLAVVAMFLHTQNEPEIENGIAGASSSMADAAESLAGAGEVMLYGLVLASIARWLPYRWWRWSHKLLGIPFVFACWHFFTADKTYANGSPWGWYFGSIMVAGIAAFVARVLVRDPILQGNKHRVLSAEVVGDTIELVLEPIGEPIDHDAGQFAVLKLQERGMTEPHMFTIASGPSERVLRFFIKDLGDWTAALVDRGASLVGSEVLVEGPYGQFQPLPQHAAPTIWVAGGVGITPFLAATAELNPQPAEQRPVLFYAVRDAVSAMAMDVLQDAHDRGVIELVVCASSQGRRFSAELLAEHVGFDQLRGAHMAVCGPAGLVTSVRRVGDAVGAAGVEHEDFDIRQGFGPDLSRPIAELTSR